MAYQHVTFDHDACTTDTHRGMVVFIDIAAAAGVELTPSSF